MYSALKIGNKANEFKAKTKELNKKMMSLVAQISLNQTIQVNFPRVFLENSGINWRKTDSTTTRKDNDGGGPESCRSENACGSGAHRRNGGKLGDIAAARNSKEGTSLIILSPKNIDLSPESIFFSQFLTVIVWKNGRIFLKTNRKIRQK